MAKKRGNNEGAITRRKDGLWQAVAAKLNDALTSGLM